MRLLDLFSGIGGFSLGLERAGFRPVAFCEINPFCRRVLARHWPGVPCYDDIRALTAGRLAADGIAALDIICGGFPCQDISTAGKGAGIDGERSGLWREYARLVRELRPRWVIVENVPALRTRGADRVLADLEAAGYACWPLVVGAVDAGAPHRRQRVWIIAHRDREMADADRIRPKLPKFQQRDAGEAERHLLGGCGAHVADAGLPRLALGAGVGGDACEERPAAVGAGWWLAEPDVGRVAHGVPQRVDRLRALGNAVAPQVVEAIGRAIMRTAA